MHTLRTMIGVSMGLMAAGVACGQVTIQSVGRNLHVGACTHVPGSDDPNHCESFNDSNAAAGNWLAAQGFGFGRSNDTGYAGSIAQGYQESEVFANRFTTSMRTNTDTNSSSNCSSEASAATSFLVHFTVIASSRATISCGIDNAGAAASASLTGPAGVLFAASSSQSAILTLPPGEYEFRTQISASGACSGSCSHVNSVLCNTYVLFEPAPCPADFNGDTAVDFFDYDDFVTCFEGGTCPPGTTADFNNDTAVDFFDYDDFVMAFEAGC